MKVKVIHIDKYGVETNFGFTDLPYLPPKGSPYQVGVKTHKVKSSHQSGGEGTLIVEDKNP